MNATATATAKTNQTATATVNNTVVRYVRVSTKNQDYTRQLNDIEDYCIKNNLTIVDTIEEKWTGKEERRPKLDAMLMYCEHNQISAIVCTELSRLGRNTDVPVIAKRMYTNGINLIPITQEALIPIVNGKIDDQRVFMIGVFSSMNAYELKQRESRQISGMRQAAKNGIVLSNNMLPYGYTKVALNGGKEVKYLAIEPQEALIVKEMFERYAGGEGIYKLACWLTATQVPTRSGIRIWKEPVIRKILKNSLYKGERKHKDLIVDCPAIVTPEIWAKVQTIMTNNFMKMDIHRKHVHKIDSGKIICGVCGLKYYASSKPKDSKYVCISAKYRDNCGNAGISITKLEETLEEVCLDYLPNILAQQNDTKGFENQILRIEADNHILQTQMKDEERLERKYVDMYANDIIDLTIYLENLEKVKKNKNNYLKNLEQNYTKITELKELIKNLLDIKASVKTWKENGISKELLNKAISKIVITKVSKKIQNPETKEFLYTRKNDVALQVDVYAGAGYLSYYISQHSNIYALNMVKMAYDLNEETGKYEYGMITKEHSRTNYN
jgi:site-specific DNA recombinase